MKRVLVYILLVLQILALPALAAAGEAEPAPAPAPAPAAGRELSKEETDAEFDGILERAAKITRIQAEIRKTESGGVFKKKDVTYQTLKYEAPDRIYLLDRFDSEEKAAFEDCRLTLFDGKAVWELEDWFDKEEPRACTRRVVNEKPETPAPAANDKKSGFAKIGVFLGVGEVKSLDELREIFNITAFAEKDNGKDAVRFDLVEKEGGKKTAIHIEKNAALPYKVESEEKRELVGPGAAQGETSVVTVVQELLEAKTNLDGLPEFAPETFVFPYGDKMTVKDDATGKPLEPAQIKAELDETKKRIENAKKAGAEETKAAQ